MTHDPRNRNTAEEWAFTGSSLITERRLSDAESAYRQALALDPQLGFAWDGLGLALLNGGRTAEAREAFDRAIAADADSARALYHLGLVHAREGRLQQAVDSYQRALALSPLDTEITLDLAGVKRKQATELGMAGRTREARDVMQSVVELTPRNGDAWLDLCLLSLDLRDVGAAEAALRRAQEAGADAQKLAFASEAIQRARR
jgi:tetratricopeptide (TPR) repeat protein